MVGFYDTYQNQKCINIGGPNSYNNGPSKNNRRLLFEKKIIFHQVVKKVIFPYYEMEQNCNFIVKMKNFINKQAEYPFYAQGTAKYVILSNLLF